jgi:hypothetical protein
LPVVLLIISINQHDDDGAGGVQVVAEEECECVCMAYDTVDLLTNFDRQARGEGKAD